MVKVAVPRDGEVDVALKVWGEVVASAISSSSKEDELEGVQRGRRAEKRGGHEKHKGQAYQQHFSSERFASIDVQNDSAWRARVCVARGGAGGTCEVTPSFNFLNSAERGGMVGFG